MPGKEEMPLLCMTASPMLFCPVTSGPLRWPRTHLQFYKFGAFTTKIILTGQWTYYWDLHIGQWHIFPPMWWLSQDGEHVWAGGGVTEKTKNNKKINWNSKSGGANSETTPAITHTFFSPAQNTQWECCTKNPQARWGAGSTRSFQYNSTRRIWLLKKKGVRKPRNSQTAELTLRPYSIFLRSIVN